MKNNRTQNTEYRIQNLKHRRKAGRGLLQALLAIVIVGVGIAGRAKAAGCAGTVG